MTDIICPLCGTSNPPGLEECLNCQAPLKAAGFVAPSEPTVEGEKEVPPTLPGEPGSEVKPSPSSLELSIPDWLKETEASFLKPLETEPEEPTPDQVSEQIDALINEPSVPASEKEPAIDDEWLAGLLAEAGLNEPPQVVSPEELGETQPPEIDEEKADIDAEEPVTEERYLPPTSFEKPDWVSDLEAGSTIKLEEQPTFPGSEDESIRTNETLDSEGPEEKEVPEWVENPAALENLPEITETEPTIAPAELPTWLEALRPKEVEVTPSAPVEDLSAADVVTAGPLSGLRGVISPQASAIRARKPPAYSIKLRVTDEQRGRVEMMEELLANEQKAKPLPSRPIITSQHISRLVIAVVLILPVIWMVISGSQRVPLPKPGDFPGVMDFSQHIQSIQTGAPVLMAFDYEAGFSGEMNLSISAVISQLMAKNAYLTLVATNPSGPALAEGVLNSVSTSAQGTTAPYVYYTNLGYIPGGTLGLLGLANSPQAVLPYSLDGKNVWVTTPLNSISSIADFSAVILMTNDPATARSWIEQVGPQLEEKNKPLLLITSAQAGPLILPYSEATPAQVQGLLTGIAGGLAFSRTVGGTPQSGSWDALSIGTTASILIVLAGAVIGVIVKVLPPEKKET